MKTIFQLEKRHVENLTFVDKTPSTSTIPLGVKSLSKIGSAIGNPLVTNECTTNKLRVFYARILVEFDITQELPQEISIKDDKGNKMKHIG